MAPAITHFLVGASLCLLAAVPFIIRSDTDPLVITWLIPIGGIWGILPDVHHVAPVFATELYAIHGSPWVSLCAFHYPLDTLAVRHRAHASIFLAIAGFVGVLAVITLVARERPWQSIADTRRERMAIVGGASVLAAGYATLALTAVVSVQWAFGTVASLVGTDRVAIGGLVVLAAGFLAGLVYAVGFVTVMPRHARSTPGVAGVIGAGIGVIVWVGTVLVGLPLWTRWVLDDALSIPFVRPVALGGLVVHGVVFGVTYALVYGAFDAAGTGQLTVG
ncbi:hypothetical protein [Halorubrum sp. AJ67]|uniref:hypothetical protein n=1 Tax=Halorubrum sp. AJ67 TaxID=1173487 RepID=UPI0003DCD66A|nr:hypothetical protein [Halorubrum sp. AJ67]CDK39358.1 putative membrane protein [Halorubrum sp. AJ67]